MAYAKFKLKNGKRVRVNLDRVLCFWEDEATTWIMLEGNEAVEVADTFQVVSNQVAKNATESAEPETQA